MPTPTAISTHTQTHSHRTRCHSSNSNYLIATRHSAHSFLEDTSAHACARYAHDMCCKTYPMRECARVEPESKLLHNHPSSSSIRIIAAPRNEQHRANIVSAGAGACHSIRRTYSMYYMYSNNVCVHTIITISNNVCALACRTGHYLRACVKFGPCKCVQTVTVVKWPLRHCASHLDAGHAHFATTSQFAGCAGTCAVFSTRFLCSSARQHEIIEHYMRMNRRKKKRMGMPYPYPARTHTTLTFKR